MLTLRSTTQNALLGFRHDGFERLVRFLGQSGVHFTDLGRLGDETFVRGLGVFGLQLDGLLDRLDAEQLLESGGALYKLLIRIVRDFDGDRLGALGNSANRLHGEIDILFADLLEVLEILDHSVSFPGPHDSGANVLSPVPAYPGITRDLYRTAQ